jgi:hypothetical protein
MDIIDELQIRFRGLIKGATDYEIETKTGIKNLSLFPDDFLKFLRIMGNRCPPMFDYDYITLDDYDIIQKEGWRLLKFSGITQNCNAFPFFVTQQATYVNYFYLNQSQLEIYGTFGGEIEEKMDSFSTYLEKRLKIYDSYQQ